MAKEKERQSQPVRNSYNCYCVLDTMKEALSKVITDEGCTISLLHAKNVRTCAEKQISDLDKLAQKLISDLEQCFHATRSVQIQREHM